MLFILLMDQMLSPQSLEDDRLATPDHFHVKFVLPVVIQISAEFRLNLTLYSSPLFDKPETVWENVNQ